MDRWVIITSIIRTRVALTRSIHTAAKILLLQSLPHLKGISRDSLHSQSPPRQQWNLPSQLWKKSRENVAWMAQMQVVRVPNEFEATKPRPWLILCKAMPRSEMDD